MITFKIIQINLKAGVAQCTEVLNTIANKIKAYGQKYANILARELDATGGHYAVEIIKEFPVFSSYRVKFFRYRIQNQGSEYVLENIEAYFEQGLFGSIFANSQRQF